MIETKEEPISDKLLNASDIIAILLTQNPNANLNINIKVLQKIPNTPDKPISFSRPLDVLRSSFILCLIIHLIMFLF